MAAHARLSPSAAARWAHCTASVRAIEDALSSGVVPRDESSAAADEGTAAHVIREECLALGLDAYDFEGTSVSVRGTAWPVTREMADALQPGIDWIRERAGDDMLVEERVALGPWLPGQFGTIDCAFVWQNELVLSDLKYGKGEISAVGNLQQQIYALGALVRLFGPDPGDWDVEQIRVLIDQPRRGGLKEWVLTLADLLKFAGWIAERGAEALGDDPVFRPSKKACEWCPLNKPGLCAQHDAWISDMMFGGADDAAGAPAPAALDPARRYEIVRHTGVITKWLAALAAESLAAALAGDPDPGSKTVDGPKGDRKWADVEAAEAVLVRALGADAWESKLKSPAQAEEALRPSRKAPGDPLAWAKLESLVTRAPGRPILVDADDPRPARASAEEFFNEAEE